MTRTQIESLARGLSPVVKELVQQQLGPIAAELDRVKGENARLVTELASLGAQCVTSEALASLVSDAVSKSMSGLALPKDGAPGPPGPAGTDGTAVSMDVIEGLVNRAIAALPKAKDGVGLAGALIDRDGQLVVTLTDGTLKTLGLVVGKSADPAQVHATVVQQVAQIPRPKDGEKGADGRDGSLEQLRLVKSGDRAFRFVFKNGDPIEGGEFTLPVVLDRGVYDTDKAYEAGDGVTWNGSFWIAQAETTSRPGTPDGATAWRLAVKKGNDGREGKAGPVGPAGPRGEKGTDGRHGYS